MVANTYLEGTYSEIYADVSPDAEGMRRLFRQFSFPGGIPSHAAPDTPGSIHEGGELGYALAHAFGAAFDNPDLIMATVVGDGEAETGPLAASWHCNKFLNPARDGAVLPILHLNGYKIANPTLLARIPEAQLTDLLRGYGWDPRFVEGDDPPQVHQQLAATLDQVLDRIAEIQDELAAAGSAERPDWPMIVLRTPKGWTGPREVDGRRAEGSWRSHQVPLAETCTNPQHLRQLEEWMRSYRPDELFDDGGRLRPELAALAPAGSAAWAPTRTPTGGLLLRDLRLPDFRDYAAQVSQPGVDETEATRVLGPFPARRHGRERRGRQFPGLRPGRDGVKPAGRALRGDRPDVDGSHLSRRRRTPQPRGPGDRGPVGTPLPGPAGGVCADRPARVVLVL